ncbi:hypothetical protein L484_003894 [Morus notabilis]|uniref:Uncharacterized protein n=1 Tax=Morus notabilis TaxID=981085 RepID=W9S1E4_9ROSA|nr:uncharacterized protein LOC21387416 [Morus notabilis]EXC03974.1 hypothetical protein L484_003894 [Morus notabilis]
MDSSVHNQTISSSKISQKEHQYDTFRQAMKYPSKHSSRRTPSFSSSSSLSSSSSSYIPSELDSPLGPATPLRFSGVPFSWEHFPGIPKKQVCEKILAQDQSSSTKLLPLPPTANKNKNMFRALNHINSAMIKMKKTSSNISSPNKQQAISKSDDPFFAALVECSKGDNDDDDDEEVDQENAKLWNIASTGKVCRSLSDRFGFINLYAMSCKRTCAVDESIRHLPKSNVRSSYDLIKYRSR